VDLFLSHDDGIFRKGGGEDDDVTFSTALLPRIALALQLKLKVFVVHDSVQQVKGIKAVTLIIVLS